ncbi:META domain-containing protein [Kribbella sandramycini]|nr:META domain-containing protein [Kribbella sandramycini]
MIALVGAGLLLALTACGNDAPAGGGSLTGKTYLSTAVTEDGKPKQLAQNTKVRLQFTDDGRLIADAGCNSMQGRVSVDDGRITLTDGGLASTDMGCPGRQDQDGWLTRILSDKPKWSLNATTLTISTASTTISLTDREVAEPDLAVDGTRWTLDTIIEGDVASHQVGAEKAWITLNGDRVTGSTGCNELQGKVTRADGKLTFGELSTTRIACSGEAGKTEAALLKALKGEVSYSVESNRLSLTTADGKGGVTFSATR